MISSLGCGGVRIKDLQEGGCYCVIASPLEIVHTSYLLAFQQQGVCVTFYLPKP